MKSKKKCPICKKNKLIYLFQKDRSRKSGFFPYCLDCKAKQMREWRKTHPLTEAQKQRDNCRSYAFVYLKRGKLIKPELCEDCNLTPVEQMHHADYSKPLEIEWLCKQCHQLRHRKEFKGVGT